MCTKYKTIEELKKELGEYKKNENFNNTFFIFDFNTGCSLKNKEHNEEFQLFTKTRDKEFFKKTFLLTYKNDVK